METRDRNELLEVLSILADSTRLAIIEQLHASPRSVGQIAEGLHRSYSVTSRHIRLLKIYGCISGERRGHEVIYSLDPAGMQRAAESVGRLSNLLAKPARKPR